MATGEETGDGGTSSLFAASTPPTQVIYVLRRHQHHDRTPARSKRVRGWNDQCVREDVTTRTGDTGEYELGACQVVQDERMLDGNARLNLAPVVATWAEPYPTG